MCPHICIYMSAANINVTLWFELMMFDFFSVPAGLISDSKRLCLFRRHARTHTHSNMHNTKPMISTKNLGTHPNIGHQSKTDWQRAILIRSNARSPQGEPLPNPIHYCPLYPFHLLGFSTSLSLSFHCTQHTCERVSLVCTWSGSVKRCLAGSCPPHVFVRFNEAPAHLQMLASVASAPVWSFNFRGAARWWTRGLRR